MWLTPAAEISAPGLRPGALDLPAPRRLGLAADDRDLAGPWAEAVAQEGLQLEWVQDGVGPAPDVDALMLHVCHGLALQLPRLRRWREAAPGMPLLVACRALRDLDHVLALEMGADDVVDGGLPAAVVAARLRALWRRLARRPAAGAESRQALRFGGLQLDLQARQARLAGQAVPLTEGEFEVLWLLALHAGEAMSRRELLRCVRGFDDHPGDRSIDNRVYRIRAKLGDGGREGRRIRTVRHRGYVFSPLGW